MTRWQLSFGCLVMACAAESDPDADASASSGAMSDSDGPSNSTGSGDDPEEPTTGSGELPTTSEPDDDSEGASEDSSSGEAPPPPVTMSPGCGMEPTGAVLDGTIDVDGVERTYVIEIPEDYDPDQPYPLIFGFHGRFDDGAGARNGYRLMEHYGGQAIVVYPDGLEQGGATGWNAAGGSRDFDFVLGLTEEIGYEMCFDLQAVNAFGYSAGGIMANALACFRGDLFSGVGAISASGPSSVLCQGPVAAFLAHGETDSTVPFNSGVSARDAWLELSGCSETTSVEPMPEGCVRYDGCEADSPVIWCTHPGAHMFNGVYAEAAVRLFQSVQ